MPLAPRVLRALSQTAAPFAEASPLPRDAFVDPAFFAMDQRLFGSAWSVVGHDSELRRPGQFRAAEVAGERVIVARGADLELHAFLDRCVHRGTQLTSGDAGVLPELALSGYPPRDLLEREAFLTASAEALAALAALSGKNHAIWRVPLDPIDPSARDVARWLRGEGAA